MFYNTVKAGSFIQYSAMDSPGMHKVSPRPDLIVFYTESYIKNIVAGRIFFISIFKGKP
jgi:hypothetical protein